MENRSTSHADEVQRLQAQGEKVAGDLYTEWLANHAALELNVREYLRCPCGPHWRDMAETYHLIEQNKQDTRWPENREAA